MSQLTDDAAESHPRRFYYGWVMLPLAMMALVASSPGQTFGVSIFNEPIRVELGLTHSSLASAYMFGTLFGALPITFIGHQMDRHGLRRTLLFVLTLFCAACGFISLANGWLMLVASFFLLRWLGPGALGLLSGNALSYWFDRRLGTVEGVRQLGMAAAMSLVPMLNVWLVGHYGWRTSYQILGAGVWLLLFPAFLLLFRNRPEDVGQSLDNEPTTAAALAPSGEGWWGLQLPHALRTSAFWILTLGQCNFALIHTAVFFCIVPIYEERGLSEVDVTTALTCFSICLASSQLASGWLSDRLGAPTLMALGQGVLAAAMLLVNGASTVVTGAIGGAAMGLAQGVFFGAAHPTWARYFGRAHLGKIRGMLMTINVASSSLGPVIAGVIRDTTGQFDNALIIFAIMPIPVAIACFWLKKPERPQ